MVHASLDRQPSRTLRGARAYAPEEKEMNMTNGLALLRLELALAAAALCLATGAPAVELDPAAVAYLPPEQFKWRDPTDQAQTNQIILHGDPSKAGLYIQINKFKPGRF